MKIHKTIMGRDPATIIAKEEASLQSCISNP